MRAIRIAAVLAAGIILSACGTVSQAPIPFKAETLQGQGRIGVVSTAVPKADMNYPGAGCLLCFAAAAATNATLSSYTKTLPNDDLTRAKTEIAQALTKKGREVKVIEAPIDVSALPDTGTKQPGVSAKDFSTLAKQHGVDKLLVLDFTSVGIERSYSAYIPNGPPMAIITGTGYLVNASNNTYEWYRPFRVVKASEGNWDEPPKFPGLTNAYFQAIEVSKDNFLKPISTGAE
jgi:hypothetical protein